MKKLILAISFLLVSASAQAADPQSDPSIAIAGMAAKLNNLEEENRKLNGKVDELQHQVDQLQAAAASAPAIQAAPPSPNQSIIIGQPPALPSATISTADGSKITKPNAYVTKITPADDEQDGAINDEFDEVFKSVVAEDYKTAKPGLKDFIAKHPGTSLAGEAYFWLGEIAWSEHDFNTAAINYLKGYKEAPTGDKASENILKMALTLKELGKKDEACKYIDRFNTEFPSAHSDLKTKAANAKTELGCK